MWHKSLIRNASVFDEITQQNKLMLHRLQLNKYRFGLVIIICSPLPLVLYKPPSRSYCSEMAAGSSAHGLKLATRRIQKTHTHTHIQSWLFRSEREKHTVHTYPAVTAFCYKSLYVHLFFCYNRMEERFRILSGN